MFPRPGCLVSIFYLCKDTSNKVKSSPETRVTVDSRQSSLFTRHSVARFLSEFQIFHVVTLFYCLRLRGKEQREEKEQGGGWGGMETKKRSEEEKKMWSESLRDAARDAIIDALLVLVWAFWLYVCMCVSVYVCVCVSVSVLLIQLLCHRFTPTFVI